MKEIGEAFVRLARATNGVKGSAILLNAGADLRDIAEQLLKERDEALEQLKAAELRVSAYREVAEKFIAACENYYSMNELHAAMDFAARIMKEKGGV